MPKRNGKKGKKSSAPSKGRRLIVTLPFGIEVGLPLARLPLKIGSDTSLKAGQSVYPTIRGLSVPLLLQVSTSVAATTFSMVQQISAASIRDFATRLGACFDEYCITGALFEIQVINLGGSGVGKVYAYLDEKDTTAATASAAIGSPHLDISVNTATLPIRHTIEWLARDLTDLAWTSSSVTSVVPVSLKAFASVADSGLDATTVFRVEVTGALNIDVRGWKSA